MRGITRLSGRRAAALACLVATLTGPVARAAECVEDKVTGKWTCTQLGFEALVGSATRARKAAADCKLDLDQRTEQLAASEERRETVEVLPCPDPPKPWGWFMAGFGVGTGVIALFVGLFRR